MDPNRKLFLIALTTALFGLAAAHANAASEGLARAGAGIAGVSRDVQADRCTIAQAQVTDAVRDLEQAALQWDFASNARELALLQWAHEDLAAAVKLLHGVQRTRTVELLADLDHAIRRASAHLGPLVSPDGNTFGRVAPSQNQLAQLATEAQDLARNAPTIHRLRDTVSLGSTDRERAGAQPGTGAAALPLASENPLSWPLGSETAWRQVQVPF